ncbi:S-adenosyl-L-methionine-dependent methyltransferases superfamily protein [Striga hermonthica]|uniref:Trimethylguanosine synthase n=1 Tax=Striga hermonthica TaxID=68872 RepID=A0A9N7N3U1_STRHE|nr:S-adenosyl-L-methionine-dependent methyltransferases superfamily protein [Striga hermonthica]
MSKMSPAKLPVAVLHLTRKQRKRFKRKVKIKAKRVAQKKKKKTSLEERENVTPLVKKYWLQRYNLFSRYDEGVKLDEEGWFSVTPEEIAAGQARRCVGAGVVIDAFAGVGGNAIQFAKVCRRVVAVEIDPNKVALAIHNAKIYGVRDNIDFIVGDFFQLAPSLEGDVIFLSPPWGGPSYKAKETFTLDLLKPKDGYSLFQVAQAITPNIIMYLPRNTDVLQARELSWLSSPPLNIEIEENFVRGRSKGITVTPKPPILKAIPVTIIGVHLSSAEIAVGDRQKLSINFEVRLGPGPLLSLATDFSVRRSVGTEEKNRRKETGMAKTDCNLENGVATLPEKNRQSWNIFVYMMGFCICPLDS